MAIALQPSSAVEEAVALVTAAAAISQMRAQLLNDARSPWFATLAFHLQPVPDFGVPTCETDGTRFIYNPRWVIAQKAVVRMAVLAHEILHCALLHVFRLNGRELGLANIAADHVVNLLLLASGFTLWEGALADPRFTGMAFEQVYAILRRERDQARQQPEPQQDDEPEPGEEGQPGDEQDQDDDPGDAGEQPGDAGEQPGDAGDDEQEQEQAGAEPGDGDDGQDGTGDDEGEPGEPGDAGAAQQPGGIRPPRQEPAAQEPADGDAGDAGTGAAGGQEQPMRESDWQIVAQQAALVAKKRGLMPGGVDRAVTELRQPPVDCWAVLREFLEQQLPSDYTWATPNRRYIASGLYLPGMKRENMPRIGIAVDTSGSVDQPMLTVFAEHLSAIVREFRPEAVDVVYCDDGVRRTETYGPDDEIELRAAGGGGTAFQPALDWFSEQADEPPACVVYLTDLEGENTWGGGPAEPDYPVLWCTTEASTIPAPFGWRVTIPTTEY